MDGAPDGLVGWLVEVCAVDGLGKAVGGLRRVEYRAEKRLLGPEVVARGDGRFVWRDRVWVDDATSAS